MRSLAYMRMPNFQKALAEIDSLIAEEPQQSLFLRSAGPDQCQHGQARFGHSRLSEGGAAAPRRAPTAPGAGSAQLAMEDRALAGEALQNLKAALLANDDLFAWYPATQAYSALQNEPMANLATAELILIAATCRRPSCSPTPTPAPSCPRAARTGNGRRIYWARPQA